MSAALCNICGEYEQDCRCSSDLLAVTERYKALQVEVEALRRDMLKLFEQRGRLSGVALNFKQFILVNGAGMNAEQRERVIQNISTIIADCKDPAQLSPNCSVK